MPRAKKDGQHINCYIDRILCERLKAYADEKGQTMTTALERILKQHFEEENRKTIDILDKMMYTLIMVIRRTQRTPKAA